MKSFSLYIPAIVALVVLTASFWVANAFTPPTLPPPGGNVAAPINVGPIGQTKDANLVLNFLNVSANGLLVPYGNVGIGTAAPVARLDVVKTGTGFQTGLLLRNLQAAAADVGPQLEFHGNTVGQGMAEIRVGWATSIADDGTYFAFRNRNAVGAITEHLRITPAGNVGIGTVGPYGKLSVAAGTGVTNHLTLFATDVAANGNIAGISFSTNGVIGRPRAAIYAIATQQDVSPGWAADLVFATRGAADGTTISTADEKMRITKDGNVGIGTAAPNSLFDLRLTNTATNDVVTLARFGRFRTTGVPVDGYGSRIAFALEDSGGGYSDVGTIRTEWYNIAGSRPRMVFGTLNTPSIMTLDDNGGNVGIGTVPAADKKLDVSGKANATELCIAGDCKTSWSAAAGSGGWTDDGAVVRLTTSTDNVGIGTPGSGVKLHVQHSTGARGIRVQGTSGSNTGIEFYNGGVGSRNYSWEGGVAVASDFGLRVSTTEGGDPTAVLLAITNTGSVGIGNTRPGSYRLNVNGALTAFADFTIYTPDGLFGTSALPSSIKTPGGSDRQILFGYIDGGGGQYSPRIGFNQPTAAGLIAAKASIGLELNGKLSIGAGASNATAVTIDQSGFVGIGTEIPSTKLEVAGTITATKLTVGTIDPVYEIDGKKYATYVADVAGGVKTEVTGTINVKSQYVIDFDEQKTGSDLWLFWQTSNKNMGDIAVLLTPAFDGKVWYEKDANNNRIIIKSNNNGEVSFRLTAPRKDAAQWPNEINE